VDYVSQTRPGRGQDWPGRTVETPACDTTNPSFVPVAQQVDPETLETMYRLRKIAAGTVFGNALLITVLPPP